jgi:hypothetical protein
MWAPHYRYDYYAFLKFSLDSLPDSCTILQAELGYYQYDSYEPQVDVGIIRDPVPLNPYDLLVEIRDAPAITPIRVSPDGWVTLTFDTASFFLLDSCRHTGWSSFGLRSAGNHFGFAYGYDNDSPPYVRIEYTSSGTGEARSPIVAKPELALAPNPATGRFVMARYDIAAGTRDNLVLRDVLGRYVQSFALDPSGITELDLRRLSPGVYIATLRTTGQSVSRKLVITR